MPDEQPDKADFNIQIDDDLLAAALASIEDAARSRDKPRKTARTKTSGAQNPQHNTPESTQEIEQEIEIEIEQEIGSDSTRTSTDHSLDASPAEALHEVEISAGEEGAPVNDGIEIEASIFEDGVEFEVEDDPLDDGAFEDALEDGAMLTSIDVEAYEAEIERLKQDLDEARSQTERSQASYAKAILNIKKLRKEVLRQRAYIHRTQDRLTHLESQRKNQENARANAESQVKRLQESNARLNKQCNHLQNRRRQEKEESRLYGHGKAITTLLPALDHLQMAVQHAAARPETILSGVQMVLSQFNSALVSVGVNPIDSEPGTPFDPEKHEAILHTPSDSVPPGAILQEITSGYQINGRLLRAARVTVAAPLPKPPPTEQQTPDPEATEQETSEQDATEQEASEQEATEVDVAEQEVTEQEASEQEATEQEATEVDVVEQVATETEAVEQENSLEAYFVHEEDLFAVSGVNSDEGVRADAGPVETEQAEE